jgi:glycosyltransferase involved in cell wall biosynthesis
MKILYVITRSERGGGQVHVADLLAGLRSRHELGLVTGETGFLTDRAAALGIPTHVVRWLRQPIAPLHDVASVAALCRLIRRIRPDVIHAHTSKAGMVARLAGTVMHVPVVFTAHTWSFTEGPSGLRRRVCIPVERICGRLSARVITVSEANRDLAADLGVVANDRMTTIWNGVPDVTFRASPAGGPPVRVLMVARFADQKDQALLVKAATQFHSQPVEFVFVGDGPQEQPVRRLACQLGLSERVIFCGDRGDVAELLSGAHIFVLSTKWEGLPLSIIEAMRAGLPVIASGVGGVTELVEHRRTGLIVPRGDENSLAAALEILISDPSLRASMGERGRKRYEDCFSYARMLSRTEQVYSGALRRSEPPAETGKNLRPRDAACLID